MSTENYNDQSKNPLDQDVFGNAGYPFYQADLPEANTVLILGILSIAGCSCYGVVGGILGIIALVIYGKAIKQYNANPSQFNTSSYNNLKAGRICAIIGLIFSAVVILLTVVFIGTAFFSTLGLENKF